MGMFGVRPAILVGVDVALGDIRETYAFMFLAMCFGFPPLGKWVQPVMDGYEGLAPLPVFKTGAFNRSATSPSDGGYPRTCPPVNRRGPFRKTVF